MLRWSLLCYLSSKCFAWWCYASPSFAVSYFAASLPVPCFMLCCSMLHYSVLWWSLLVLLRSFFFSMLKLFYKLCFCLMLFSTPCFMLPILYSSPYCMQIHALCYSKILFQSDSMLDAATSFVAPCLTDALFAALGFFASPRFAAFCFAATRFATLCFAATRFAALCFAGLWYVASFSAAICLAGAFFAALGFSAPYIAALCFAVWCYVAPYFTALCFVTS